MRVTRKKALVIAEEACRRYQEAVDREDVLYGAMGYHWNPNCTGKWLGIEPWGVLVATPSAAAPAPRRGGDPPASPSTPGT